MERPIRYGDVLFARNSKNRANLCELEKYPPNENWHNERLDAPILPSKPGFVFDGLRTAENQEFFRDYKKQ
tara:strand:+ start:4027 stop:4239 length:213 start_codon:yes stop_codon:yes gene_type:complete